MKNRILRIVGSFLFAWLLLEGGAFLVLYFGIVPPAPRRIEPSKLVPVHPYMGHRMHPREKNLTFDDESIPLKNEKKAFHVVISGGSVAYHLHKDARERLLRGFENLWGPTTLNVMAVGGLKQPQNLHGFVHNATIGRTPDLIISLDGFNEIALPIVENYPSGAPLSYPRTWSLDKRRFEPAMVRSALKINLAVGIAERLTRLRDHLPLNSLALFATVAHHVACQVSSAVENNARDLLHTQKSFLHFLKADSLTTKPVSYEEIKQSSELRALIEESIEIWARSSEQLAQFSKANQIGYIHLLQPNQYFENSKPLTDQEIATFQAGGKSPYGGAAKFAYPLLAKRGERLRKQGIEFHDLTQVFSQVNEDIYVDDCCHVNSRGSHLLADSILKIVGHVYNAKKIPAGNRAPIG